MADYATVTDIIRLKRALSAEEQNRAQALIPVVCDTLRYEAIKVGKNLDEMIYSSKLGVQYDVFTADGSDTSFDLNETPVQINSVTFNGVATSDYTVENSKISFNSAPAEGVEIMVTYSFRVLLSVAKAVTVDIIMRELNTPGTQLPSVSYSEGAGSVSQSYALPNASGRIAPWPSDLKALGLKRQQIDTIDLMARPEPPLPPRRGC